MKSKIATLVYKNYTENVDMLNPLYRQSELDALIKTDKDLLSVYYYFDGVLVGNRIYSEKQAISQILKMNITQAKISEQMEYEAGNDWFARIERNKKRTEKIQKLYDKMAMYKYFITEEGFNNSDLPSEFCCRWEDFLC